MINLYKVQFAAQVEALGFTESQYKELRSLAFRLGADGVATLNKDNINLAFTLKREGKEIYLVEDSYVAYQEKFTEDLQWTLLDVKMYRSCDRIIRRQSRMFFQTSEELDLAISFKRRIKRIFESLDFKKHDVYTVHYGTDHNTWEITHSQSPVSLLKRIKHGNYIGYILHKCDSDLMMIEINQATKMCVAAVYCD